VTDDQDQARFEEIYRRHFRSVLRYALARVDPERAKDVTAETFLVAWRRLPEIPAEPRPWLFGVARRVIAGQFRADTRREALTVRMQTVRDPRERVGDLADEVAERDAVLGAFARLGDLDREALRLVTWDGLTSRQAAEVLGLRRLTFAVRLHRARQRLANELAAVDGPSSPVRTDRAGPRSRRGLDVAAFESTKEVR
jgi:RNA polymerase sigma-70 factor (ECF subfamily)